MTESAEPRTDRAVVVAIDGPAGAGKSTIARLLAQALGLPYLDTGAMYRVVGLLAYRRGIAPPFCDDDLKVLEEIANTSHTELACGANGPVVRVDGEDVTDKIREPEISTMASAVSAVSEVRRALVPVQREMGLRSGGVMEGRDVGSVIFPNADLKIFLTASPNERAQRRTLDLASRGISTTIERVVEEQGQRDHQDSSRPDSPLQVSAGAVVVDTTGMTRDEVVNRLVDELEKRTGSSLDTTGENTVRSRNHGS
ncbi:MAG: (d)CMP kinase [bacterium]|nr:(d)CMP kinase [bacterium]